MSKKVEDKLVQMGRQQAEAVEGYLRTIPGVTVLPADDLLEAVKGFLAFHVVGNKERSLWFGWRFAKPVSEEQRRPIRVDELESPKVREDVENMLRDCIRRPGWVPCDRPKEMVIGFAYYRNVDSAWDTRACFLYISTLKKLDNKLCHAIMKWRSKGLKCKSIPTFD
jgi:hypothetical protein